MNAEIRTLLFNQGVGVAVAPLSLDSANKVSLTNNAINDTGLTFFIPDVASVIIDYTIYRKTQSGFKSMTGRLTLIAHPEGATDADKWSLQEVDRLEILSAMGITFSNSPLVNQARIFATLDNMAGLDHSCTMYYKISTLLA